MRVVFVGSSRFGLSALHEIAGLPEVTIVGVLTNPESFGISYSLDPVKNVLYANFQGWASEQAVPYYVMEKGMKSPALGAWLHSLRPDLMVVVGWYHMIPRSLRQIAPAIGLHASLLPDYSGGAPLVWAMINGEKVTGVTLFEMDDGVDNGGIYGQACTPIFEEDTIASLYSRIESLGIGLLKTCLPGIAAGTLKKTAQNDAVRRVFPQRNPSQGLIDWRLPARDIYNFVRAQTHPYPGAYAQCDGKKITIWTVRYGGKTSYFSPGHIVDIGGRPGVVCGDGSILECIAMSVDDEAIEVGRWLLAHSDALLRGLKFDRLSK
jgi:methionyl-tRNA formyltransferase